MNKENTDYIFKNQRMENGFHAIADSSIDLVLTSPPYGIKKDYEKKTSLEETLQLYEHAASEIYRVLSERGSVCWQVGNHTENNVVTPLDIVSFPIFAKLGFQLRNRIVWSFNHGLHSRKRFSARHETILWFSKSDKYKFNLDSVRVPQKYPRKKFYKGPNKGKISSNPLGKNPGDSWEITNVKHSHPEKIAGGHPCQTPEELARRLILATTDEGDTVLDPFAGVASVLAAALKINRSAIGFEKEKTYYDCGMKRLRKIY